LSIYLRHEPDSRVVRQLAASERGRETLREASYLIPEYTGMTASELAATRTRGVETLVDPTWSQVATRRVGDATTIDWTEAGSVWRGSGEPWEGRTVNLEQSAPDQPRVLRFAGCRTEGIGQWLPATPGALYTARVNVRAKTSPGTATFLIVTFLDEYNRHIGIGRVDRLPADAATVQETELCVMAKAPANARFIGFGVRVLNQINDDFAEFSAPSLEQMGAP
jgi:hypothetical protein